MTMQSTILIGDPVFFRRHPGAHEEPGRCVGRAKTRAGWEYDVEPAAPGAIIFAAKDVRLDTEAAG